MSKRWICEKSKNCGATITTCAHKGQHDYYDCGLRERPCHLFSVGPRCIPVEQPHKTCSNPTVVGYRAGIASDPTVAKLRREIESLDCGGERVWRVELFHVNSKGGWLARAAFYEGDHQCGYISYDTDDGGTIPEALYGLLDKLRKRYPPVCPECGRPR